MTGLQGVPRLAVPARPHRTDRLCDLPEQLIGEPHLTLATGQPSRHRGLAYLAVLLIGAAQ